MKAPVCGLFNIEIFHIKSERFKCYKKKKKSEDFCVGQCEIQWAVWDHQSKNQPFNCLIM